MFLRCKLFKMSIFTQNNRILLNQFLPKISQNLLQINQVQDESIRLQSQQYIQSLEFFLIKQANLFELNQFILPAIKKNLKYLYAILFTIANNPSKFDSTTIRTLYEILRKHKKPKKTEKIEFFFENIKKNQEKFIQLLDQQLRQQLSIDLIGKMAYILFRLKISDENLENKMNFYYSASALKYELNDFKSFKKWCKSIFYMSLMVNDQLLLVQKQAIPKFLETHQKFLQEKELYQCFFFLLISLRYTEKLLVLLEIDQTLIKEAFKNLNNAKQKPKYNFYLISMMLHMGLQKNIQYIKYNSLNFDNWFQFMVALRVTFYFEKLKPLQDELIKKIEWKSIDPGQLINDPIRMSQLNLVNQTLYILKKTRNEFKDLDVRIEPYYDKIFEMHNKGQNNQHINNIYTFLDRMNIEYVQEAIVGPYIVDLFLKNLPKNAPIIQGQTFQSKMKKFRTINQMLNYLNNHPNGLWIEIDGPKHFIDSNYTKQKGGSILKREFLRKTLGIKLKVITSQELNYWNQIWDEKMKFQELIRLLSP